MPPSEIADEMAPDTGVEALDRWSRSESEILEQEFLYIHGSACLSPPPPPVALGPATPGEPAVNPPNERRRLQALYHAIHSLTWPQTALCLSGGGIRSATFCLGVLQVLAQRGMLRRFGHSPGDRQPDGIHYLSTVSGGGYIGSWLSAWLARQEPAAVFRQLEGPATADGPAGTAEAKPVTRLRAYSNWLAPKLSRDAMTLMALYVRNLCVNLLVLLPLVAAVLIWPRAELALLRLASSGPGALVALAAGIALLATAAVTIAMSPRSEPPALPPSEDSADDAEDSEGEAANGAAARVMTWRIGAEWCPLLLCLSALCLVIAWRNSPTPQKLVCCLPGSMAWQAGLAVAVPAFLLAFVVVLALKEPSRLTHLDLAGFAVGAAATALTIAGIIAWVLPRLAGHDLRLLTFIVPLALVAYFSGGAFWIVFTARQSGEAEREWWAAAGGGALAIALGWLALHIFVFCVPPRVLQSGAGVATSLIGAGGLAGILTAIGGFRGPRRNRQEAGRGRSILDVLGRWALDIGALVFLVVFLGFGGSLAIAAIVDHARYSAMLASKTAAGVALGHYKDSRRAVKEYVKAAPEPAEAPARPPAAGARAKVRVEGKGTVEVEVSTPGSTTATSVQAPASGESRADPEILAEASAVRRQAARRALEEVDTARGRWWREVDRWLTVTKKSYEQGLRPSASNGSRGWAIFCAPFILGLASVGFSALVGVNTFSMHSLYMNRLVRAYLGASAPVGDPPDALTGFSDRDNLWMHELRGADPAGPRGPFHVVGIALNLVRGARLEWQERKASSFIATPLRAGSWMLGYRDVKAYGGRYGQGLSLGRAMAISGAAVNPNWGYHSSPMVAAVMAFFNARLGWWLPNPGPEGEKVWGRREPLIGVKTLLDECLSRTDERGAFVNLSDGGHFDNLGLYEMVRRRCGRIIVVDATADAEFRYEDLAMTVRKIRTDMGIRIEFPRDSGPACQRPPKGAFTIGWIHYPDADGEQARTGLLIYIKPRMSADEPVDVDRYAREHQTESDCFPHQTTFDLFFDESQFESYRMLGAHMASQTMDQIKRLESFHPMRVDLKGCGEDIPATGLQGVGATPEPSDEGGLARLARSVDQSARPVMAGAAPGSFWSWTSAPLLAGAVTAGGLVGVTGMVALAPSTVTLQNAQVSLAPGGEVSLQRPQPLPVEWPPPGVGRPPVDWISQFAVVWLGPPWRYPEPPVTVIYVPPTGGNGDASAVVAQLERSIQDIRADLALVRPATSAVARLDAELWRLRQLALTQDLRQRGAAEAFEERLRETDRALQGLQRFVTEEVSGRISAAVGERLGEKGELFKRIDGITQAIQTLGETIGKDLGAIQSEVERAGPRQNIRGE